MIVAFCLNVMAECPLKGRFGVRPYAATMGGDVYDEVSSLQTMIDRKNFFATLSPEDKSAAWQRHFDTVLKTYKLTFEQRGAILAMKEIATTDVYINRALVDESFTKQLRDVFDVKTGKAIFDTLGPKTEEAANTEAVCQPCDCRPSVSWCSNCVVSDFRPCTVTQGGCGPAWLWDCTGCCVDDVIIE